MQRRFLTQLTPTATLSVCATLFALTSVAGCASRAHDQPDAFPAIDVAYYVGTSATTSPDGNTPFGPTEGVAVRRTLDRGARTIEEYVVHPGAAYPTTLRRVGDTTTFDAQDDVHSFSGTLTYAGPEWAWTSWTYAITMTDGSGTLAGTGLLGPDAIDIEKMFRGPDGAAAARIVEHLERVEEATFAARRDELLGAHP